MLMRVSNYTRHNYARYVVLGFLLATGATGRSLAAGTAPREKPAARVIDFRAAAIQPVHIGVMGAAAKPGVYRFAPGEVRLNDLLSVSGGLQSDAADFVRVVRNGRMSQMIRVTDAAKLDHGDLVIIPTTPTGSLVETRVQKQGMDIALVNAADRPIIVHFTNQSGTIWQILSLLGQKPADIGTVTMIAPAHGQVQIDVSRPPPPNAPRSYGSLLDGGVIVFRAGTVDLRRTPEETRTELLRVLDVSAETNPSGPSGLADDDRPVSSTGRRPPLSPVDSQNTYRGDERVAAADTPRARKDFSPRITPGRAASPNGYDRTPNGLDAFTDGEVPHPSDRPSLAQSQSDSDSSDADRVVAAPADSPGSWQTRSSSERAAGDNSVDEEIDTPDALSPDTVSQLDPDSSVLAARTDVGSRQAISTQDEPIESAQRTKSRSVDSISPATELVSDSSATGAAATPKSTSLAAMLATPLCLLTVGGILLLLHQRANRSTPVGTASQDSNLPASKNGIDLRLSSVPSVASASSPILGASQLTLESLPLTQGVTYYGRANPHEQVRVDAPHISIARPRSAPEFIPSPTAPNRMDQRSAFERALFAVNQGRP